METLRTKLIEKEEVTNLHFPTEAIQIRSRDEQKLLVHKLETATTLGNVHHNKIKIIFQDDEGLKEVRTTIWATGEKHIVLKKGIKSGEGFYDWSHGTKELVVAKNFS